MLAMTKMLKKCRNNAKGENNIIYGVNKCKKKTEMFTNGIVDTFSCLNSIKYRRLNMKAI